MTDAHQHFWQRSQPFNDGWLDNPALARINRDFLPEDLLPDLQATGVAQSIFVQTKHADPSESRNVIAGQPELGAELRKASVEWFRIGGDPIAWNPEYHQQLKAIRYTPSYEP
jgi:predicted TIM-barrel fold metal-dependent hydrolase